MFPLIGSCVLFLIDLITVVRSRFVEAVPIGFTFKNVALVLASLCGFAVISSHVVSQVIFERPQAEDQGKLR